MHLFINFGLPFSIHLGRLFVFETDFTRSIFIRLPGIGQFWKARGWEGTFDPWAQVRGKALDAMPFIR
jgi:hypothetical protein